jgi:hypothetical protein
MNFRNSTTAPTGGAPDPAPLHPKFLTLGAVTSGQTQHSFNVGAAKKALLAMPVSLIQGVKNFLDGTSTPDQNNQLYEQLSTYAKTHEVGIGFHSQSKQVDVAVTDAGTVYTQTDDGTMTQVYPNRMPDSTGGEVDEKPRVSAYGRSGPAMIDAADTDVTTDDLNPMNGMDTESTYVPKRIPGRVYASPELFGVRHPGSGKQSTTTNYSHVVAQMSSELDGSYVLVARRR